MNRSRTVRDHFKRWLWLFTGLLPISYAQGCCPLGYVSCSSVGWQYCTDYNSSSIFSYAGTDPVGGPTINQGACVWCTAGCSFCVNVYQVIVTDCCGSVGTFSGTLCCKDYSCCN